LAVAGTSYSYDGNGNATAGGGLALTWDAENRLTQFSAGSTTATFVYDASGGRLGKTDGTNVSVYPFGDDYEITNGEVTKYLAVDRVGVVAKRVGSSGAIQNYWLHTDSLGSIQTTSDAGGAEVQRRTFGPYGETTSESGSESRGWIDQRLDPETGLTYLHARYYASHFGMFISPDPMHPASPGVGMNRYAYGLGDPINRTDRSGLAPCELVAGEVRCWDWSRAGGVPGGGGPGGSGGGGGGSTGSGSTGGGVGGGRSGGPAGGGGGGAQREGFCRTYPAFCQEEQEEQETPQPDNPTTPDRRQADGEMHETADDAASSVLIEHNPQSIETNTEYCFGICERDGSYFATPAQWSFEKPTESCDLWTYCPGGGTLVGHAHTHARYGNDGFSGVDVAGWRTPGFGLRWVSTPALNIWKFDPTREGSKIILLCDDCFE
jgi:RHS repeat-associated protein